MLARVLAAATLAEAVTWESIATTRTEARPFRRVSSEPEPFENPEKGFHRADDEGRIALLQTITGERAESLLRRRVRLRAGTLDGGRILLTRLTSSGTAELPFSAFWVEHVRLEESSPLGGPGNFLVSWLPASHLPAADRAMASGAPHAWCEDSVERFAVTRWRPAWVR